MEEMIKSAFYMKIKDEENIYANFSNIMNKVSKDGYMESYYELLAKIFKKEIYFAIKELLKIEKEQKDGDITKLIRTNLFVFKENLKLIFSSSSKIKSGPILEFDKR